MIDIDKYEGHTLEYGMHCARLLEHLDTEPNRRLIADALPLLEEVKRLFGEVKRLRKEVNHAKVTIDEWDNKGGPCVTVHLEGCEYVGMLRLHKDENGKVIE